MELEGKRFSGANIMSVAEKAAAEYGCSVDDLDYELLTDEENEEPIDEENPVTIIVYGVLESAAPKQSEERQSMPRRDMTTTSISPCRWWHLRTLPVAPAIWESLPANMLPAASRPLSSARRA